MSVEGFSFEVIAEDGPARIGRLTTPHAVVETPVFMPVGTQATVKTLSPSEVAATGSRLILANTYHLMLRPTAELVARLGGVQRFMAWPHAVLTDSGGYQVFSLAVRIVSAACASACSYCFPHCIEYLKSQTGLVRRSAE